MSRRDDSDRIIAMFACAAGVTLMTMIIAVMAMVVLLVRPARAQDAPVSESLSHPFNNQTVT